MPPASSGRHQAPRRTRTRRALLLTTLALVAAALVAVGLAVGVRDDHGGRTSPAAASGTRTRPPTSGSGPSATPASASVSESLQAPVDPPSSPAAAGVPVRVTVARLGIDSTLDRLDLTRSGLLQTPKSFGRAAWFERGVRPGDVGPAVIAGHVDSRSGPAVFYALKRARAGDTVDVRDSAGVVWPFVVTAVRRYAKAAFGTAEVYGPTTQPQLRLITCTGVFDSAARSYRDNLVVFATLREARAG